MKALDELQTHISFQEQTIAELNDVVTDQQKQIDVLRVELRLLRDRLQDMQVTLDTRPAAAQDEKPPHY